MSLAALGGDLVITAAAAITTAYVVAGVRMRGRECPHAGARRAGGADRRDADAD